ncbi:MAG: hypothetical protein HY655_05815 [Acidobacteria bacterium]|nr:hypothetical protein [Acidobacteriota bacterium]
MERGTLMVLILSACLPTIGYLVRGSNISGVRRVHSAGTSSIENVGAKPKGRTERLEAVRDALGFGFGQ